AVADKLEADRELQWNAAMTLARLGSPRGKLVLMNMLDRSFWEGIELSYEEDHVPVRRKYEPVEVSRYLSAAIDAAAQLDDAELNEMIARLEKDKTNSFEVREAARAAIARKAEPLPESRAAELRTMAGQQVAIGAGGA